MSILAEGNLELIISEIAFTLDLPTVHTGNPTAANGIDDNIIPNPRKYDPPDQEYLVNNDPVIKDAGDKIKRTAPVFFCD